MILDVLDAALAGSGLVTRGGFHARPGDRVPEGAATVVMVGNVGGALWAAFAAAVDARQRREWAHPLDHWTRGVVEPVARAAGGSAVYPFDGPPWHPFQAWAERALAVFPSPIGPLIDPDYGLWHAYRAAVLFAETLPLPPRVARTSPCATCRARPCLTGCPVNAIRRHATDVPTCVAHILSGDGDCREFGCRARRACPVGAAHAYPPDLARFHMEKFVAAYGG